MIKKDWKQIDKNFIAALVMAGMLLLLAVYIGWQSFGLSNDFQHPYGGIFGWIFSGIGLFLVWIFFVWLLVLAFCIFIFAFIARLIYTESAKRIFSYRILMGFSFAGQLMVLFSSFTLITDGGWTSVIGLLMCAGIFWIIFLGMRGTYTERLKQNGSGKS